MIFENVLAATSVPPVTTKGFLLDAHRTQQWEKNGEEGGTLRG